MTYLGREGDLEFSRDFPEPVLIPNTAVAVDKATITINSSNFWLVDEVVLVYIADGGVTHVEGFLHRDVLDRISIHSTAAGGLNNTILTRVSFTNINEGLIVLALKGSTAQTTFLRNWVSSNNSSITLDRERTLRRYASALVSYRAAGTNSTVWRYQGGIQSWSLNPSSSAVSTSALGENYGSSTKGIVTGTGSLDFLLKLNTGITRDNSLAILRLILMFDSGATAQTRFYLKKATTLNESPCSIAAGVELSSALYYSARILVTDQAIRVTAEDFIAGSVSFSTTGPIRLGSSILDPA